MLRARGKTAQLNAEIERLSKDNQTRLDLINRQTVVIAELKEAAKEAEMRHKASLRQVEEREAILRHILSELNINPEVIHKEPANWARALPLIQISLKEPGSGAPELSNLFQAKVITDFFAKLVIGAEPVAPGKLLKR